MNAYARSFGEGLRPDPHYTISDWADKHRVLPSKGAAEPGRYRTARTPFLKEIMDCLSPHSPVQRVVFMKSSQVGGTELGLNWLGCVIHMYPAPMMIVQPTIELAERFSKQRVAPMIDETPELRALIAPSRTRDSGNSILLKEFRGGVIVMAGSNSGVSLRQMPVKYLFCDEISGYEPDADGEGDPVSLAEKRTQTFGVRKKVFLNSTPKEKESCRIEFEYLRTDQRRYFVPCPHCGAMQYLKWAQMKWDNDDPKTAKYQCEQCHEMIDEYHKTKMLEHGQWYATAQGVDEAVRGYHISALYSPVGWKSWVDCVKEFLEAVEKQRQGDAALLKAFVNSILGETWEDKFAAKVGAEGLRARAETYEPGVVPAGALVLTAGVDVQDDRIEISIYGYGRGEESWLVQHSVIYGDPEQMDIYKQVDDVLLRKYRHVLGGELNVSVAGFDTGGHHTQTIYQYIRSRRGNAKTRFIALKGSSVKGRTVISKPNKVDVNFRGQVLKNSAELYMVGTDTAKSTLYNRFKIDKPGPGFVHFHAALSEDFFEQITSEKKKPRLVKGFSVWEWHLPAGKRNEALDCAVYAYAAMQWLYMRYSRASIWDQFEKKLGVSARPAPGGAGTPDNTNQQSPELIDAPEKSKPEDETPLKKQLAARKIVKRRNGGFVSGF